MWPPRPAGEFMTCVFAIFWLFIAFVVTLLCGMANFAVIPGAAVLFYLYHSSGVNTAVFHGAFYALLLDLVMLRSFPLDTFAIFIALLTGCLLTPECPESPSAASVTGIYMSLSAVLTRWVFAADFTISALPGLIGSLFLHTFTGIISAWLLFTLLDKCAALLGIGKIFLPHSTHPENRLPDERRKRRVKTMK